MNHPLISVIIPAYNVAEYLGNCLESVLNQTYHNIEVIVVDDGSTDKTGTVADTFQRHFSERVIVFHTDNQGVTKARFEGIKYSHGEWIGFVDGDDEIEPDMYECLYSNAIKYSADISHCGQKIIVNGGERVHEFYNTGKLKVQNKDEGLRDLLGGKFEPSLYTKLFRRELMLKLVQSNAIDQTIKYNEDVLMNYVLFTIADKSVLEDLCKYHYLARQGSATRKGFKIEKILDPVTVRRQILEDVTEDYKELAERGYLTACMHAYEALYGHIEFEAEYKELQKIIKENRNKWNLLRKNDERKLRLLMTAPGLYHFLYGLYSNTLQKKQYE